MSILSENLRYLRVGNDYSQEKLATRLIITRPRWQRYEDGKSEPPLDILLRISRLFNISIDLLLTVDLRKVPQGDLLKLPDNRILLPITVDRDGENFIEVVPHKARAGYLTGYSDPEFIESLQHLSLPFLGPGKHRAFPVEGDSMPPHEDGSFVVGRYVERLGEVMDGKTYILLTKSEGIVYKRLNKNGRNALMLHSDNTIYQPYEVRASDILEIWEFKCSIGRNDKKPEANETDIVKEMFRELRNEIQEIKRTIN